MKLLHLLATMDTKFGVDIPSFLDHLKGDNENIKEIFKKKK